MFLDIKYCLFEDDLNYNTAEIYKSSVFTYWGVPTTLNANQDFWISQENQIPMAAFLLLELATWDPKNTTSFT